MSIKHSSHNLLFNLISPITQIGSLIVVLMCDSFSIPYTVTRKNTGESLHCNASFTKKNRF